MQTQMLRDWANRLKLPEDDVSDESAPVTIHEQLTPFYRRNICATIRALYRPEFIGFEKLPMRGPAVIACNHVSYADGPIIQAGSERPIRFVIDDEIYQWPVVHYFMALSRAIPIAPKRESVEKALETIDAALKAGDIVCIFPEGQLTYTGSLSRFKPGIESIIKRSPVPVYPMALTGLWGSLLSRKYLKSSFPLLPRLFTSLHVRAICGDPIPPEQVTIARLQQEVLRLKYS